LRGKIISCTAKVVSDPPHNLIMHLMPSIFSFQDNKRSIFFFDAVYSYTSQKIISDLIRMNEEDKEKPINFFINSGGGLVSDMFAIVDVMKVITAPINTFVLGNASSAASLIAACGDKRFITANSEMMIHGVGAERNFNVRDREAINAALTRTMDLNDKVAGIYSNQTGKPIEEINKLLESGEDIFMNAEKAISFGLVDEVLTEDQLKTIKLSEQFKKIKLSEAFSLEDNESEEELKKVHLLKECSLSDRGVEITKDTLLTLKANFDSNIRGQDISIDYTHDNDEGEKPAGAWIKELELSEDQKNLFAMVEFTPNAKKMIEDREYKYLSVEIDPLYQNEEGKMFSNVLLGGTFTNRPAVKGLDPIKLSENINNNKIDMELSQEEITSLESIKSEMSLEIKDFYNSFAEMKQNNQALMGEISELKTDKSKLEEEANSAKEALLKMKEERINAEKLSITESLVEKGIIANSQKEKVLSKFSSKSEIEDFYRDVPASINVEARGLDLEDVVVDSRLQELSKQTGQSIEDLQKYGNIK